jgi:hypothetical protein
VDAVLIGTPDFSHARITIDAIAAGKDVYVEKPATNTIPSKVPIEEHLRRLDVIIRTGGRPGARSPSRIGISE